MPYSQELGLVFVAIPKTGTSSVSRALIRLTKPHGGLSLLREKADSRFREKYRLNEIGDKKPGRTKHLSAIQLKYVLGEEEFQRCTKFSVVRNPWARMVSRYRFTHSEFEPDSEEKIRRGTRRTFHSMEFESWLDRIWQRHKSGKRKNSQLIKLTDLEGNLLVDHVGKLEDVQSTLNWVTDTVGIARLDMPHVNGTNPGHYAPFYNPTTRDMVSEICRLDIEYFGYSFEEQQ